MSKKLKKKTKDVMKLEAIFIFVALGIVFFFLGALLFASRNDVTPSDSCTDEDRKTGNCVPAGKCGPTPEADTLIDCQPKKYDRKYNTDL